MQNRLFMQKNMAETDIHNNHMTSQVVCTEIRLSRLKSKTIIVYSLIMAIRKVLP